jgi:hypothetical protein
MGVAADVSCSCTDRGSLGAQINNASGGNDGSILYPTGRSPNDDLAMRLKSTCLFLFLK